MKPELEQRVSMLEKNENNSAFQAVLNRIITGVTDVNDGDVARDVNVTIGEGSDTIQVLDYPDKWLRVQFNGKTYRVPAYLETEDATR